MCDICSDLTIKTPNHINDVVLVFLLLTLNLFHHISHPFSSVSFVDFEQVNVNWVTILAHR